MKTAAGVAWGLKTFPGPSSCSVPDGTDVAVAADNFAAIDGAIKAAQPSGDGTPTSAAIAKAVAYLKARTTKNPKYLVLATDGEPNCKDNVAGGNNDIAGAVKAIGDAAAAGFHTFVIGVATLGTSASGTLDMMAAAGLEPRPGDPRYYAVSTREELVAALGLITGRVASCSFPLEQAPPSPDDVAVNVNGARVKRDPAHAEGWDYGNAGRTIEVYGKLCEQLKAGSVDKVDIIFGCPGVLIP